MNFLNILLSCVMACGGALWFILWAWIFNRVFGLGVWYEIAALVGVFLLMWLLVSLKREEHNHE
jgi:Flp pilus assembly protein TadB